MTILLIHLFFFSNNPLSELDSYKWKNRIIVVDVKETADFNAILKKIKMREDAVNERDIIYFLYSDDNLKTNSPKRINLKPIKLLIEERYPNNNISTVLIGKDGGIKSVENFFDLDRIFNRIDAMPMRIQEMREPDRY